MFTGIIQHMGRIAAVDAAEGGLGLWIDPQDWSHRPAHGDSVAVNGCCLTVTTNQAGPGEREHALKFDVIHQTRRLTTLGSLRAGDMVNLEHAATPTTLLGGHLVQGHVDGVGTVASIDQSGGEWRVRIAPPPLLMEFIAAQGSICVDGVSLTVASLGEDLFEVALIPTTLRLTSLANLSAGSSVNVEVDCIAKTVVNWLKRTENRKP
jgi:riboflavin synthase